MEVFLHIQSSSNSTTSNSITSNSITSNTPITPITLKGTSFGFFDGSKEIQTSGELVFQTGMVGYNEALTDPSYTNQILMFTYPIIGNYGVPNPSLNDKYGISKYFESDRIHCRALIVDEYVDEPNHYLSHMTLSKWLYDNKTIGVMGIDTRALTELIREQGTLPCIISTSSKLSGNIDELFKQCHQTNLVSHVSTTSYRKFENHTILNENPINEKLTNEKPINEKLTNEKLTNEKLTNEKLTNNTNNILVIDCGIKNNQLRCLLKYPNVCLHVVNYCYDFVTNPLNIPFDRIFISNGPGDPKDCTQLIQTLKTFMFNNNAKKPIFGICLGHQILALAAGFNTHKLKYGNRGHNIPCKVMHNVNRSNDKIERCFITSQNHGYAVIVNENDRNERNNQNNQNNYGFVPLFININDQSNEGLIHTHEPWFSVQFHPEACAGPQDTEWLFDAFIKSNGTSLYENVLHHNVLHHNILHQLKHDESKQQSKNDESKQYKKVLVLGSGALSIGQSGEFDYSGSQAIKAYKEEGLFVVLVNPNIATVQTSSDLVDKIYFLPVNPEFVEKIIQIERPDCIALSFGGQTGLNCGATLYKKGILEKYNVQVLGTCVDSILKTEDREIFKKHIESIGEQIPNGVISTTVEQAINDAKTIGYPVLVRAAFALGGLGSGFANNETELISLLQVAFANSDQVIIDKSLKGWKEIEYEVVRDRFNNCITVCNMENFDPLGVHTGESIVVAPSQTLTDKEYNLLRSVAIKAVQSLEIVGECNIQYALDPLSEQYYIIEINARLSRSSALASKATGYPLAYVAAKLSLGYSLADLKNSITKTTSACFEPSLDYCVIKIPKWDLEKFDHVSHLLDSSMKSVGEGMAISRTFEEALQKAIRMTGMNLFGVDPFSYLSNEFKSNKLQTNEFVSNEFKSNEFYHILNEPIQHPTPMRLMAICAALFHNVMSVDDISKQSGIDKWFLYKIQHIIDCHKELISNKLNSQLLYKAKYLGFSDKHIAHIIKSTELEVRHLRQTYNIYPCVKKIDTVAAEFPCNTNYLYSTYKNSIYKNSNDFNSNNSNNFNSNNFNPNNSNSNNSNSNNSNSNNFNSIDFNLKESKKEKILVIGSGVYKIGSSVEFDWCTVNCIRELRRLGKEVIMINCNPETVSTDYDEADKLYFDEISFETVMDICHYEKPDGVIVSVGGQIPNNIAMDIHRQNIKVLGTSPESIDAAENRFKFSRLLEQLGVDQPTWKELTTVEEAKEFCNLVQYPCLVRPSYVLSGAAMNVAYNDNDLMNYLQSAIKVSQDYPVVISKFIQDAKEIEVDAVAHNGWVKFIAISEHVENAGVHSGDATLVLPAQDLTPFTVKLIQQSVYKISQALKINGPFNIQFIAKDNRVKVIECNLRVSRSFPFVSKTLGVNFIQEATRIIVNEFDEKFKSNQSNPLQSNPLQSNPLQSNPTQTTQSNRVGVKVSQFSFNRLKGSDILLDVEMKSTGEVACFGLTHYEAYLKALIATGFVVPKQQSNILLTIGSYSFKEEFKNCAKLLSDMGFKLYGTHNTANFYNSHNISVQELVASNSSTPFTQSIGIQSTQFIGIQSTPNNPSIITGLKTKGFFSLIVNISERNKMRCSEDEFTFGYKLRRLAVESNIPIFTDIKNAKLLVNCLSWLYRNDNNIRVNPMIDCFSSMKTIRLPGLIDVHVHVREPGEEYKEDWSTCTKAALAGGICTILAMPNTKPAVMSLSDIAYVDSLASKKAHCNYGLFMGANSLNYYPSAMLVNPTNTKNNLTNNNTNNNLTKNNPNNPNNPIEPCALKLYLNSTHGDLTLQSMDDWVKHLINWKQLYPRKPICVHAESTTLAAFLFMLMNHFTPQDSPRVHICHVSSAEEINLVKIVKQKQYPFTCEVAPHHLFANTISNLIHSESIPSYTTVKPPLGKNHDVDALWANMDIIDCFATDHAPHTTDDKLKCCPGFPGLETALPLLLNAVHENKLTINDIILRYHTNPAKIFNIPTDPNTYIEIYPNYKWVLPHKPVYSKCGWSPFGGKEVYGFINRVVFKGQTVVTDGKIVEHIEQHGENIYLNNLNNLHNLHNLHNNTNIHELQNNVLPSNVLPSNVLHCDKLPSNEFKLPSNESYCDKLPSNEKPKIYNLLDLSQLNRTIINDIFELTDKYKTSNINSINSFNSIKPNGKILGLLFYEPSTRTRCSFESAMLQLGGNVINVSSETSSVKKGESIEDTIKTLEQYCDAIVLRHPDDHIGGKLSKLTCKIPIINAGFGSISHPTQALLDLYTIRDEIGTLTGKTITFVGDLKYSRTVHSLIELIIIHRDSRKNKNIRFKFVSPTFLKIPESFKTLLTKNNLEFTEYEDLTQQNNIIETSDILYITRIQKERHSDIERQKYEQIYNMEKYSITPHTLSRAKPTLRILHPLPRVDEISPLIDTDPRAAYFRQMKNGLYVRMAILKLLLEL